MFRYASASRLRNIYMNCLKQSAIQSYLTEIVRSNGNKNALSLTKRLFIKGSMARRSHLGIFSPRKSSVSASAGAGQSFANCLLSEAFQSSWSKKIISPVTFDTNHSFKRQNTLSFIKRLFIKFSMERHSHLVIFFL